MFDRYALLAIAGTQREYPNQPAYRLGGDADVLPPREVHPAFYGCYDWHSAVHSHWFLIRLLRERVLSPGIASQAERVLREHLTTANLQAESAYFDRPGRGGFEWPYGWAWLLALHAEAARWDSAVAEALQPLAKKLHAWIPARLESMRAPQRSGQHTDTAFALQLMLEAGVDPALTRVIHEAAERWYLQDVAYPWAYDAGPYDFHSPGLTEAGLMQRVLTGERFADWLQAFWPSLFADAPALGALERPTICPDDSDGKLAHLHGLNLERARGLKRLAEALSEHPKAQSALRDASETHEQAGLQGVLTGEYAGEHWLATFAVRLLLGA